jgi:hypothetical protein
MKASMKLLTTVFASMIVSATAEAKNCLKVDEENSPAVTLSGHITTQHKIPKNSELRAAEGYYLRLDTPLQADLGAGCWDWVEIAINGDEHANQLARLNKRHVIVAGKLGRFGSALVDPPIFIRVENIQ